MLFSSEKEKRIFLENCYLRAVKIARWKYWSPSNQEMLFTPEDIAANAIISFCPKLDTYEFESEKHAFYYFRFHILSSASSLKRKFKYHLSLDAPITHDSSDSFESFIASRAMYPSLENDEFTESINSVINRVLNKEQQELIQLAWIEGNAIAEIAKRKRMTEKYLVRSLNTIKLKLSRQLFFTREKIE